MDSTSFTRSRTAEADPPYTYIPCSRELFLLPATHALTLLRHLNDVWRILNRSSICNIGVLTVQVYAYYQDFPEDSRAIKILVAVLWIIDLIDLILISYPIYYYLVTSWGNVEGLARQVVPLSITFYPIAFSILFSQLFLLYRIWIFSQRNLWVVGPVFLCSLAAFSLIAVLGALAPTRPRYVQGMVAMVVVVALTDLLIAVLLCYFIRKRSEGTRNMRVTSTLVNQVIMYTVATGAFTSALIIACLIAFFFSSTFIAICLHFLSGRSYANAVLVNLNARRKFRETLDSMEPSFAKSAEIGNSSSVIQRMPRLGNLSVLERTSGAPTSVSRSVITENKHFVEPYLQAPLTITHRRRPRRHSIS
ncbi:hypothetical protein NP233_g10661 [Leucocoprinus birnbaumii]|uniref:DUF6534 domain-containing protein n=1 Tax=Leucocoprinus birnbaumii TaxID=56174 RepID=A0AAD5YLY7_9AGAR|nr:hypothetical protein NP233_g10661 [Leucocoprinus birnbaumii]